MKRHHRGDRDERGVRATILVVDDDSTILALCERVLKGYRVLTALCRDEALRQLDVEAVDLVLTDVKMPGGSGIDLLRTIKQANPNAPVLIMSGYAEQESVLRSLRDGADDFIAKQFLQLQLRESVEKALHRGKMRTELADRTCLENFKSDFLSLVSHKLRTPVTTISLILQDLNQNIGGADAASLRQTLAVAGDEVAYLGRLVEDLLLFGQVAGRVTLEREAVDPAGLVAEALRDSPEAQSRPDVATTFRSRTLPLLNLDRRKVLFALRQLIDNAFKFSPEAGRVSVEVRRGCGELVIVVADSGVGIPREELERVFDKFYQIDPEGTGQVRGLGLGLYYAREFIRLHGGSLTLESEPGRGTTATVILPLQ